MVGSPPPAHDIGQAARPKGRWVLARSALLLVALVLLSIHLDLTVNRPGRAALTYDSAEFAIAGRQLARTGALSTTFVHPDELVRPRRPPFPLIVGHPLVPILDAIAFRLGGARSRVTLVPAGLAFLVLVACASALGRRVARSNVAGFLAGLAVASSPDVLYFASEGLSEIPFAAALVGAFVLLWDLGRRPRALALGLVLGVAHLARPIMVPLLPAWLLGAALAAAPGQRRPTVVRVLLGFLVCAVPLALYKLVAAGNPLADVARYNLLSDLSPEFDPVRIHRMLAPPSPLPYLAGHLPAVWNKLARVLPGVLWDAVAEAGVALGALCVIHVLRPPEADEDRPFRATWLASTALFVLLVALSLPSRRYLFPLLPVLAVVGIAESWRLAARLRLSRPAATLAGAALIIVGPLLGTIGIWSRTMQAGPGRAGGFREQEWQELGAQVARRLPERAVAVTDVGPFLAWYAERPAVLLPNDPEDLPALARRVPVDAVVLTNHWLIGQPGSEAWRALYFAHAELPGWTRRDSVTAGRLRAVIFAPAGRGRR